MKNKYSLLRKAALLFAWAILANACQKDENIFEYGQVSDIDGNQYKTITIGHQIWMAENLRTTRFSDGTAIFKWSYGIEGEFNGAYTVYPHNDVAGISSEDQMVKAYGMLYNWYSVEDPAMLCPQGWRVPLNEDYELLVNIVAVKNAEKVGDQLKSCRYVNSPRRGNCSTSKHPRWDNYSSMGSNLYYGTNKHGFSALPAGMYDINGVASELGMLAAFWTQSVEEDWGKNFGLGYSHSNTLFHYDQKSNFYAVRCIKE